MWEGGLFGGMKGGLGGLEVGVGGGKRRGFVRLMPQGLGLGSPAS